MAGGAKAKWEAVDHICVGETKTKRTASAEGPRTSSKQMNQHKADKILSCLITAIRALTALSYVFKRKRSVLLYEPLKPLFAKMAY